MTTNGRTEGEGMPHSSRVALITGCGKPIGIGNSTARALAAKGVAVVVSDVRPAGVANEHNAPGDLDANWGGVDSLVEQIEKAGGTAMAVLGDVSQEADARRMVEEVLSRYGRLDILVNNARAPQGADPNGIEDVPVSASPAKVPSMTPSLASDEAAFVPGQAMGVDGGW